MSSHLEPCDFLLGDAQTLRDMALAPSRPPFHGSAVRFLDCVSKRLMSDPEARPHTDVVTFGFWCRSGSVQGLREACGALAGRTGRGVAFHITPANVPVNFAYSLGAGLLAGNCNVVRVPSRPFAQVDLIARALRDALAENPDMAGRIALLRYGHDSAVTDEISSMCDVRIIWGGDDTIRSIRESPLPPRALDLTFADRYSFAMMDADAYLRADPARVAQDFFNDTYLTDQRACTSPQLVVWRGTALEEAKARFWGSLHRLLTARYVLQPMQAVEKWAAAWRFFESISGRLLPSEDNLIMRIHVSELQPRLAATTHHSGLFLEYDMRRMEEILPLCTTRCQTVTYLGVDGMEIADCLAQHGAKGVDRIVPVGRSMDFSLLWDGHDLIRALSRVRHVV